MRISDNRKVAVGVTNMTVDSVEMTVVHPDGREESITFEAYYTGLCWFPVGSYLKLLPAVKVSTIGAPLEDVKVPINDVFTNPHYILKEGVCYNVSF